MEARLRELGVPDVDGWRARVEAGLEAQRRVPWPRRLSWWVLGKVDGIRDSRFIARRTREIEAQHQAAFLGPHRDYADALRRGDRPLALQLLAEINATTRLGFWRSANFRRLLLADLRARGFSEDDIAFVASMLVNLSRVTKAATPNNEGPGAVAGGREGDVPWTRNPPQRQERRASLLRRCRTRCV